MKHCPRCSSDRPSEMFYRSASSADGLSSYCRPCSLAYQREWKAKNLTPEKQAEYRNRFKLTHPGYATLKRKEWGLCNPEKQRELRKNKEKRRYERKMRAERGESYVVGHPSNRKRLDEAAMAAAKQRKQTRRDTRRAINRGKLEKLPCQVCGMLDVEAHHHDYSKPLDVTWLCTQHHREVHNAAKPVLP
jgi:hypothetical protein